VDGVELLVRVNDAAETVRRDHNSPNAFAATLRGHKLCLDSY
jgi:hypothetical protein